MGKTQKRSRQDRQMSKLGKLARTLGSRTRSSRMERKALDQMIADQAAERQGRPREPKFHTEYLIRGTYHPETEQGHSHFYLVTRSDNPNEWKEMIREGTASEVYSARIYRMDNQSQQDRSRNVLGAISSQRRGRHSQIYLASEVSAYDVERSITKLNLPQMRVKKG